MGLYKFLIYGFAILYFISPFDLLPDFIHPIFGRLDDVAIALVAYSLVNRLLQKKTRQKIFTEYQNKQLSENRKEPHEILGVARAASARQIKKAYHEKMSLYHPDKVDHLGSELKEFAKLKAQEIQRAYAELKIR